MWVFQKDTVVLETRQLFHLQLLLDLCSFICVAFDPPEHRDWHKRRNQSCSTVSRNAEEMYLHVSPHLKDDKY